MKRAGHMRAGFALVALVGLAHPATAAAEPAGSATAQESLLLCKQADQLSGAEKDRQLTRGLQLAEDAVAADTHNGKAHFAVVCNLGKQMELAGLSLRSLFNIRRLRRELDTTLGLTPDDADVLVAKGALLLKLPRLLGGDAKEAEQLLRRALALDPKDPAARTYLAEALTRRGARTEAEALVAQR